MRDSRPLLTCLEAAERLHVSESTFRRLRRSGVIPEIVVGKRSVRIDPDTVEAYILASRQQRIAASLCDEVP